MWLWRLMYGGAVLGFAIVLTTFVMLVWFLFEIGFGWIAAVLIGLASWLVFSGVKNRKRHAQFDVRR